MATHTCRICKSENLLDHEMKWEHGYVNRCKECWTIYCREYRQKRKAEGNPVLRMKQYGITEKQYHKLVEIHLGGCAICKQPCQSGRRLAVDHNHKTGKIRGLLCMNCNNALGRIKEDEDILSGMIEYLKNDGVLNYVNY